MKQCIKDLNKVGFTTTESNGLVRDTSAMLIVSDQLNRRDFFKRTGLTLAAGTLLGPRVFPILLACVKETMGK